MIYAWRGELADREMVELVEAHGGNPAAGWWERMRPSLLGRVRHART